MVNNFRFQAHQNLKIANSNYHLKSKRLELSTATSAHSTRIENALRMSFHGAIYLQPFENGSWYTKPKYFWDLLIFEIFTDSKIWSSICDFTIQRWSQSGTTTALQAPNDIANQWSVCYFWWKSGILTCFWASGPVKSVGGRNFYDFRRDIWCWCQSCAKLVIVRTNMRSIVCFIHLKVTYFHYDMSQKCSAELLHVGIDLIM